MSGNPSRKMPPGYEHDPNYLDPRIIRPIAEKPNWRCPQCSLDPTSLGAYCDEHRSKPNAAPYCACPPNECHGKGINECRWELMRKAGWKGPNLPDSDTREMSDLIERLRDPQYAVYRQCTELRDEAADALAAQAKEIEALRKDAERYRGSK